MNKDLLDVELLDRVQYSIEENICSYEIEEIEDIFNEDKGEVQRCITFNRGTKNDCMIISPDGLFRAAVGDDLSPELVMGVANTLIRYAKYQH
jgi:hypothetical protein|tara:strand:- start:101 stop:379 length:279 start_codon:yes stop_codon:yes gene_type:complete